MTQLIIIITSFYLGGIVAYIGSFTRNLIDEGFYETHPLSELSMIEKLYWFCQMTWYGMCWPINIFGVGKRS